MTIAAWIAAVLNALAAIPKICSFVESVASAVALWWVQRQTSNTLSEISDASAMAARATTDDQRYAAAAAFRAALSRPRVS